VKAGWEVKPLGEVCELKPPKKLAKAALAETDLVSFAGMSELGELQADFKEAEARPLSKVYSGYTYFADGDVLVAKITPCFENGKMGIARNLTNGIGFGSSEFVPLRTNGTITPEFLFYFLLRDKFRTDGAKVMSGAVGHKRVPHDYFLELHTPIPPLEEQKQIVAVLDAAFEGLTRAKENAEANLQNARELFDGFTRSKMDGSQLDTKRVKLSEICSIASRLVDPKEEQYQELLHLGAGNMITESDVLVDVKTAKEEGLISGKHPFTEHDVLYSKIRPYLKKVARPPFAGLCSADVYPLTPCDDLDRNYFFHLLMSPGFTDYAIAGSGRAGMPKVNRKHLFDFEFDLPKVAEQVRIAAEIDLLHSETNELDASYNAKLTDISDLRQSLLQKAFAGELT
jgi:type I restriction enzyme, S subunit